MIASLFLKRGSVGRAIVTPLGGNFSHGAFYHVSDTLSIEQMFRFNIYTLEAAIGWLSGAGSLAQTPCCH
jgi:hypothetical protein